MAILMKVSERGWRGDVQVWTHEWSAIGIDLEAVRNNNELETVCYKEKLARPKAMAVNQLTAFIMQCEPPGRMPGSLKLF